MSGAAGDIEGQVRGMGHAGMWWLLPIQASPVLLFFSFFFLLSMTGSGNRLLVDQAAVDGFPVGRSLAARQGRHKVGQIGLCRDAVCGLMCRFYFFLSFRVLKVRLPVASVGNQSDHAHPFRNCFWVQSRGLRRADGVQRHPHAVGVFPGAR